MPTKKFDQKKENDIIKNLEKTNKWSHTWLGRSIRFFTEAPYLKIKTDDFLKELQKSFPCAKGKTYSKHFFIKLHKLVLATKAYDTAYKKEETAQNTKDIAQEKHNTTKPFSLSKITTFFNLQKAKIDFWLKNRTFTKAKNKANTAEKSFVLTKIKQNPTLKARINSEAKNEFAALTNFFKRKALKDLKIELRAQHNLPDDFCNKTFLKEYAVISVITSANVQDDLKVLLDGSRKHNSTNNFISHKRNQYIANKKNQLRLAVRVADNVSKALKAEIKKNDSKILNLEAKKAELKTQGLKFTDAPWDFIKAWGFYIRLGFKTSKRQENTAELCKQKLTNLTETRKKHAKKLQAISHARPMFWGFSSADKHPEFMQAVNSAKTHIEQIPTLSTENFGLATELEKDTYDQHFNLLLLSKIIADNKITADSKDRITDVWHALYLSVKHGPTDAIKLLLDNGADINITDAAGWSALHFAAANGHVDVAQSLLKYKANAEAKDNDGWSALHLAAKCGSANSIKLLLDHGAHINTKDDEGWSALHFAAINNHTEATQSLLKHKANVEAKDNDGWSALHLAAKYGSTNTIKLLLDHGADINTTNKEGQSALDLAKAGQYKDSIDIIIQFIKTAFFKSTFNNVTISQIQEYLDLGIDINDTNEDSNTLLHLATQQNAPETISWLLNAGADVNAMNKNGETALTIARKLNDKNTIKIIQTAVESALLSAATEEPENLAEVAKCLAQNIDVDAISKDGYTALLSALSLGHENVIGLLLQNGANINIANDKNQTALHFSARGGNTKTIELLLQNKADTNLKDDNGNTALHHAVEYGHADAVKLLLSKTDINNTNNDGNTALHIALSDGKEDIAHALLEHGARTDINNRTNETPRQVDFHNLIQVFEDKKAADPTQNSAATSSTEFAPKPPLYRGSSINNPNNDSNSPQRKDTCTHPHQ